MNKGLVLGLLGCFVATAHGAEAVLFGEGEVIAPPDYVEMTITVNSKCYATPDEARQQTDAASRKIVDFLNTKIKKKDAYNTVITQGGLTSSYQNYQRNKAYCQNTFQKKNSITFRTQDMANFDKLYNDIQNTIYKEFAHVNPATIESPISYVTMTNAHPHVTLEARDQLEQKAIALALQNAKSKLFSLFANQPIRNLKVIEVSEFSPEDVKPPYSPRRPLMMKASAEDAPNAPIQFDDQNIQKTIYFKFHFEDIPINNRED